MKIAFLKAVIIIGLISSLWSCNSKPSSHEEMIQLLKQRDAYFRVGNYYASAPQLEYYDSIIRSTSSRQDKMIFTYNKCYALIALGRDRKPLNC